MYACPFFKQLDFLALIDISMHIHGYNVNAAAN